MNRKPLRKKDIIKNKKGLIAGTDGDEGYGADAASDRQHKVARFPGNDVPFVK